MEEIDAGHIEIHEDDSESSDCSCLDDNLELCHFSGKLDVMNEEAVSEPAEEEEHAEEEGAEEEHVEEEGAEEGAE